MEQVRQARFGGEYMDAFSSLRAAKNWFWWLLLLALLVNLAAFVSVRFWPTLKGVAQPLGGEAGLLPNASPIAKLSAATQPAEGDEASTQPATTQPVGRSGKDRWSFRGPVTFTPANERVETLRQSLFVFLPMFKSLGVIAGLLLSISLLVTLWAACAGRLSGVGYIASAFCWSIVLAAIVMPWDAAFGDKIIPGVFFSANELIAKTDAVCQAGTPWYEHVLYYARFVGWPVLAFLLWLAIQMKFSAGLNQIRAAGKSEEIR